MTTFEITLRCCADDGRTLAQLAADAEHALENGPFRAAEAVAMRTVSKEDPRQPALPGMEDAR